MADVEFVPFDFSAFTAKYRYQILGKSDTTYSNIAQSLPDDWRGEVLKSRRISMARQQQDIDLSASDTNTKEIEKALSTVAFAKTTILDLRQVVMTANVHTITNATTSLVNDLSSAVTHFKAADGDMDSRKGQFYSDVREILGKLKTMMFTEQARLSEKNPYFHADLFNAQKIVANTINTLDLSA